MRLARIRARNFRGHVDTDIEIPDGLTVFVGPNGSGKTSLFEGVLWCLYGAHEARSKVDGLLYWNADPGAPCSVETWIEADGDTYRFSRSLSSGEGVYKNGSSEPIAEGASGVSEFAETLIGLDRTGFREAYFTEQKATEVLKGKGPTDRGRFYARVMGHGPVQGAQSDVRNQKKIDTRKVDRLAGQLDGTEPVDDEALDEAREAVSNTRDRVSMAELEHDTAASKSEKAAAALDALNEARQRIESLKATRTQEAAKALQARERASAGREALDECEEAQRALTGAQARVTELQGPYDEAQGELEALRDQRATLTGERNAAGARLDRLKDRGASIVEIGPDGECHACGQSFGSSYEDALAHVEEEVAALKSETATAQKELTRIQREILTREGFVNQAREEIKEARARVARLENMAGKAEHIRARVQERESRAEEAERKVASIDEMIADAGFDEDAYDKASRESKEADARASDARVSLTEAKSAHTSAADRFARLKRDREKRAAVEDDLGAARTKLATTEDIDRFLTGFRAYLNDRLRPVLSDAASDVLSAFTAGEFPRLDLDEDFRLVPYKRGREVTTPSGGEEDVSALAMRIATARVMSERSGRPVRFTKLDEVFAHIDKAERIPAVMGEFRRMIDLGVFRQVIMIEHREEVEEHADTVFRVTCDPATEASTVEAVQHIDDDHASATQEAA